eukprot:2962298-Amphidinium_carterae.1
MHPQRTKARARPRMASCPNSRGSMYCKSSKEPFTEVAEAVIKPLKGKARKRCSKPQRREREAAKQSREVVDLTEEAPTTAAKVQAAPASSNRPQLQTTARKQGKPHTKAPQTPAPEGSADPWPQVT